MIKFIEGNLFESSSEALVNTVNTVGVMGKGIALQFKNQFPNNFKSYSKACKEGRIEIGKLFLTEEESLIAGKRIIINFPTKTDWRKPSEYEYIEYGLKDLAKILTEKNIHSVAIPPLGAGHGGLDWNRVKELMQKYLADLDCEILIYQPDSVIQEVMKKERAKLTPARAMLLSVLFDLVKNGEFVSEFAAEKVAYFLQRFGAEEEFKLNFQPNFYGPYSGKLRHVLYNLNGSYISGYSAKDKKPFEELGLNFEAENDIENYLKGLEDKKYSVTVEKTKSFLTGFYSSFALELLSTVDYIMETKKAKSVEAITKHLEEWSDRKKTLFTNPKFISIAVSKLQTSFT